MDTRKKLDEAKYFLDKLVQVQNNPNEFYYNLSAFLSAWRSVLDVMLYDFVEKYSFGFNREEDRIDNQVFKAVAKALKNDEALQFIKWWRQKQDILGNSPLWKKRTINVHRGYPPLDQIQTFYVSGSGGTAGTISPYVESVSLPSGSTLGALVPKPSNVIGIPELRFSDFPWESAIEMCKKAYEAMEKIVEEAETSFNVKL